MRRHPLTLTLIAAPTSIMSTQQCLQFRQQQHQLYNNHYLSTAIHQSVGRSCAHFVVRASNFAARQDVLARRRILLDALHGWQSNLNSNSNSDHDDYLHTRCTTTISQTYLATDRSKALAANPIVSLRFTTNMCQLFLRDG